MSKSIRALVAAVGLLSFALAGCGPITPSSLLMKGAMWAGKEVIKREFKRHQERERETESRAARRRPSQSSSRPAKLRQAADPEPFGPVID